MGIMRRQNRCVCNFITVRLIYILKKNIGAAKREHSKAKPYVALKSPK